MPTPALSDIYKPTLIDEFKGLYANGIHDTVPDGYWQDCLNVGIQDIDEVKTRFGIDNVFTLPNIRRCFVYKRLNETPRFLILDTSGNFYDSLYGPPLISNPAFEDFSMVNYANRAYITFHNRVVGVGPGVYVYQGDGTIRLAAGSAPIGFTLTVADSLNSGSIEVGTHLFAVAFEYNTGYVTPPGPEVFTVYEAPGGLKANVGNIPIGPAGVVARWILTTRVQPDYDGNQLGAELFFLQRVGDNTTTSVEVDFFDANLYVSADYLFDLLPALPAGTFIGIYKNRLFVGGFPIPRAHEVMISRPNDPESVDGTVSFLVIDPSDAQYSATAGIEFRNTLHIFKGNRCYVTMDSADDPVNWVVDSLDKSVGTQCFGISTYLDAQGTNNDRFFVADPGGIYSYEGGIFRKPVFTFNIGDIWARINKLQFNKVQLALDAENSILYAAVPLDNATEVSHLLVGFFRDTTGSYGFINANKIRWSIFLFPKRSGSILVDTNAIGVGVLKFGSLDGNIYEQNKINRLDDGAAITSYIDTGLYQDMPGWVHQFGHLQFRVKGIGFADLILKGEDNVQVQTYNNFLELKLLPGREYGYKFNFTNEKMSIKFGTFNNANDYFHLYSMILESKPKWRTRVE